MIHLPNGCYCSEVAVSPKNWDKAGASTQKDWFIHYRFYDPNRKDSTGRIKPMLRNIKGMNSYKLLSERRAACRLLVSNELKLLKEQAYNPFTGLIIEKETVEYEIDPSTEFTKALKLALDKLHCEIHTTEDIKSMLNFFNKALLQLRYATLPIHTIRRRHIKVALAHCGKIKEKWSAATFNKYRSYLMMLFVELIEHDAIESNPVRELKKMKGTEKLRLTLTDEERVKVNDHLKSKYYPFWRFMQIFFHSGGRIVELLNLQTQHVDLIKQTYIATIKKGKVTKEVRKTIKDIALPLWQELLDKSKPMDHIFSTGLAPGTSKIRREQLTRRWNVHVKEKLGIKADLYSLKHLNTTEVVEALNNEDAAKLNSHTSTAMVEKIYDVKAEQRQHERLKKLANTF